MNTNPYSVYKIQNKKQAESVAESVAYFFELAANHMKEAGQCIERNDIVKLVEETQKAQEILGSLAENLQPTDPEIGDVAEKLYHYYSTMMILMSRMVIKRDITICAAIEKSLRQMQSCWLTYGKKAEKEVLRTSAINDE